MLQINEIYKIINMYQLEDEKSDLTFDNLDFITEMTKTSGSNILVLLGS